MRMQDVVNFASLYEKIKSEKMPLKTAYKFSRLMKELEKEISFYQTEFSKIIQTYAKKNEDGGYAISSDGESIEVVAGKELECNNRINELKNLEIDINNIHFSLEELEGLNLTIMELSCIISLIED